MPCVATCSPLIEPDVRISRIRLSRKLSPKAYAENHTMRPFMATPAPDPPGARERAFLITRIDDLST
jgi:hypothetical protein